MAETPLIQIAKGDLGGLRCALAGAGFIGIGLRKASDDAIAAGSSISGSPEKPSCGKQGMDAVLTVLKQGRKDDRSTVSAGPPMVTMARPDDASNDDAKAKVGQIPAAVETTRKIIASNVIRTRIAQILYEKLIRLSL